MARWNWRLLGVGPSLAVALTLAYQSTNMSLAHSAVTESGVELARAINVDGQTLLLMACGTRDALWSDIFVAALYLPSSSDGVALGDPDRTKAVRLTVTDGTLLPNEIPQKYREALATALEPRDMHSLAKNFTKLSQHDTVWLTYAPRSGLSVILNGETVLRVDNHQPVEAILTVWGADESGGSRIQDILSEHRC